MNDFDIFADSAANLTDGMLAETGVKIIPFHYIINGEEKLCYEQGKPFEEVAKEFYTALESGTDIKTSLVCEQQFIEALTPSLEAGKDVILVTITASLSGTYAQAAAAVNTLKAKFPDRKIYLIDSANASLGEGYPVYCAAKMRADGKSVDECALWIEENKYLLNSYVTVNDLKYLRKGGRVSAVAAVAGAILNIKPMLKANGNSPASLVVYSKERGRRKSLDALLSAFDNNATDKNCTVCIAHGDCEEEANALAEQFYKRGAKEVIIDYYDLCTGAHVGPGTLAVFFFGKDRRTPQEAAEQKKKLLSFLHRKPNV